MDEDVCTQCEICSQEPYDVDAVLKELSRYFIPLEDVIEAVKEWLTFKTQYLKQAKGRTGKEKRKSREENKDILFPFSTSNFNAIWRNALRKAKLSKIDEKTGREQLRVHNLRKYFRLRVGRFGRDEAEALMGYQEGLNKIYARFDLEGEGEERLAEIYNEAIKELSIYQRTIRITSVDKELREQLHKTEIASEQLAKECLANERKIKYLNDDVEKLTKNFTKLNARFEHLTSTMNMNPAELESLVEFIGKMRQAQSREAFVITAEDNKEARELFKKEGINL